MIQAICVLAALCVFGYLYARHLSQVVLLGHRVRFRIADLLILMAGVALLSAGRLVGDAIVLCALAVYIFLTGRMWMRVVQKWTTDASAVACNTSAAIMGSFCAWLPLVATGVMLLGPWTDFELQQNPFFPKSFIGILIPGILLAWACIWGDNYEYDGALVLTGLPINIVLCAAAGWIAGTVLGIIGDSMRRRAVALR